MKNNLFLTICMLIFGFWAVSQNAWINELHYDDGGTDANEVIEIVIENPGGYTLSDFSVYLYNGNGGATYSNESVDNFTEGNIEGNYTIYYWLESGIQNGAPDGLALVYSGTVISGQFLSYEGTFTATDGPANGETSVDIGVSEDGTTLDTESLQLSGSGTQYSDFTWQPPATSTVGSLNNSQTFISGGVDNPTNFIATTAGTDQIDLSWTQNGNSDDVMVAYTLDGSFGTPEDGTPYDVGDPITGGGEVIYNESGTSTNHSSLSSDTRYYYMAWSVDGSTNYSTGVSSDTTTLADEPTTDPTAFSATPNSTSEITVTWTDATGGPSSYIIKGSDVSYANISDPGDGVSEGNSLLVQNVSSGTQTHQFTGLSPSTTYYFKIYPYNGDNGSVNYKTDNAQQVTAVTNDPTGASAGDIIITEIMQNPSDVSDTDGEWFEIYNTTGSEIDIDGWTISDNGSNSHLINNGGALNVPVGGYLILGINTDIGTNGGVPVDYEYTSFSLANGDDEIILTSSESVEINRVEWDGGPNWPDPAGKSMTYAGTASEDNNVGSKWVTAVARENNYTNPGGTETDFGSPKTNGLFQNLITSTTWTGTGNWSEGNGVGATNWSNGSPGSNVNVIVDGTLTVDMAISSGIALCNDLTLLSDASVTVGANNGLTTYGDLDVASSKSRAAATFTVGSSTTQNGSVIVHGSHTGSATVERYFQGYDDGANNGWHFISSPVNSMTISGTDFDPSGTDDDLYWWEESTSTWKNYKANAFDFTNGQGYLNAFQSSATKNFVGTLITTNIPISDLTNVESGFNLLGNPYASSLVWKDGDWLLSGIGAVAQVWEESKPGYTQIDAFGIIPSTNGFFVEVATAPGSLTIPASARTHDIVNNYKRARENNLVETLDLRVTNDENNYYDMCRVGFKPNATEEWDIEYDAHKLFGGEGTSQIWSVMDDEIFVYNYLPYVYESYQLPIHFRAGTNATHHINVSGIESFYNNSEIYLEDLFVDELINLSKQQLYTFTASTDDAENRFILHFHGVTSVGESPAIKDALIYAYDKTVYIKLNQLPKNTIRVEVFNTLGQQVTTGDMSPATLMQLRLDEKPGIYIVRLRTENGLITQKVMIK